MRRADHDLAGARGTVLLVASAGGHLAQLHRLAPRIVGEQEAVWATFDSPQSRSLLSDARHAFVPYSGPRDLGAALRNTRAAARIMRELKPSLVVSTGSAIAVSFLPVARVMGIPAAYIESAARADGPSLTGRIIRWTPGVQLFSQYRTWARPPWHYVGSVFDGFTATELPATRPVGRIVVTLGTIGYGFRRLVERILQIVPEDCEVVWQVGETDVGDLPIAARSFMSTQELEHEMQVADVVVAHAGIGSALAALAAGRCPILVPRDSAWGEHVDDHQRQIAATLAHLGLALNRSVEALSQADLVLAAGRHVEAGIGAPRLDIVGRRQSVAAAR